MTNIMLNEYRKFNYKDKYFILHVEDMKAYCVNKVLYDEMEKIEKNNFSNGGIIGNKLTGALEKLNIIKNTSNTVKDKSNKEIEFSPVTHISLNVTQSCNLACIYCYGGDGEYDGKGFMTLETAKKSIDWLIYQSKGEKRLVVTFFGGEPLLNFKLIKKIVKYSQIKAKEHKKEILFTVTTNGTLLDERKQKYLIENNITVVLSIDGNLTILNNNRPFKNNLHSHKTTIENVKNYLNKRNGKVTARATITKFNYKLDEVALYLSELGFKNVYMTEAAFPQGIELKNKSSSKLELDDQNKIFEYFERLAEDTICLLKERQEIIDKFILVYIKMLYQRAKKKNYCGVGRGLVGISKTGDIYPCHRFVGKKELKMGNTQAVEKFDNDFYLNNKGITSEICKKCWAKYFCGGGCIYESLQASGSLNIPDEGWCIKLKKIIELSIYVYDQLNDDDKKHLGFISAKQYERTS